MSQGGLKSIKEILEKITSQKEWEKGGTILRWRDLWCKSVGPFVAKNTEVVGVRGKKAVIAVVHSVLASELAIQKPIILEKLREKGGEMAPQDLIFKVDPTLSKEEKTTAPADQDLDPATKEEIKRLTASLRDPELRERFTRILIHSFHREGKK